MKQKLRYLFGAVFALSLVVGFLGCVSQHSEYGTKLSSEKIAQIKKGVTTRAEVEALLGPPANVAMMPEGKRVMNYSYSSSKTDAHATAATFIPLVGIFAGGARGELQMRIQTLQVMLNVAGIVEDYEFADNTNNSEIKSSGLMGISNTSATTKPPSEKKP